MQPCSLDEYVYVGALGLPEGLHATLRPIHREILMINMSSGEQETDTPHWSRSTGAAASKSATTKDVHANMFSVMEDDSVVTSNHRVNQQTWQHFLDPSLSIVYSKLCIGGHYNKYGLIIYQSSYHLCLSCGGTHPVH